MPLSQLSAKLSQLSAFPDQLSACPKNEQVLVLHLSIPRGDIHFKPLLMIRPVYYPAVLLSCLSFFCCNTPSEQPTNNWQDRPLSLVTPKPIPVDTAGLQSAFEAYSAQTDSGKNGLPLYWPLLTMIDEHSGMIPRSVYLDDSTGFDALFFRKQAKGYLFYNISSLTGHSIAAPAFPEMDTL